MENSGKDTNFAANKGFKPHFSRLDELRKSMASDEARLNDPANATEEGKHSYSENLLKIFKAKQQLREAKSRKIVFTNPLIMREANPVIFPNTINVIQGQAGVHKSRLAEILCSCILMQAYPDDDKLLGFIRNYTKDSCVLYVDTERNTKEQFPYALQSIQQKAGYSVEDHPENFDYITLLDIRRTERFQALKEYLDDFRSKHPEKNIFIVLDVTTDCIKDFNRTDDSMELIDLMNQYINEYDVTFLALIHENPGGAKARGHLGTEIMNKASTVIQVGFEKDASQNDTDLIRVKYLKCRSTKRLDSFHIKYSQEAKGLVLADASEVSEFINKRKHKAGTNDIIEYLETYLGDGQPMKNADLMDKLCADFKASSKTVQDRLKVILTEETEIFNANRQPCKLIKAKAGKEVVYSLQVTNPY